ncbi:hypothetical protein BMI91_15200 [Thioclava sediminum]|uniref:Uncharacterized protein n=1 Tax=Thioclava sediminum TaxID=1915319 RepID=A0ABX3MW67_9RHOB|nr:hypothetical protein BMI91_15200 [Thioclava sediminum]
MGREGVLIKSRYFIGLARQVLTGCKALRAGFVSAITQCGKSNLFLPIGYRDRSKALRHARPPHHPRPHRLERSGRRIFYCSIGHTLDDLRVDQVTEIIRRGMRWAGLRNRPAPERSGTAPCYALREYALIDVASGHWSDVCARLEGEKSS